ncbi:MAG: restriction endonuclease subunit S [Prevotella sp.]|nr:restriction endonuclease subunit S [Prevotella sp.]
MREGWEYKTIENCTSIEYGTRVVQKRDGGTIYPVYGGGGETFRMDRYNREDCLIIARFAMSPRCVRYVAGKFFLNDSGLSVKSKEELEQAYLNYHLLFFNDVIYHLGKGAAQRNLDVKAFRQLVIAIPPKSTQLSIVSELDKLNELIRIKKEQLKDYDTLAQSIFYEMFGDPVENEKGWEVKKLGEVSIYPKERVAINQICSSQYVGVENLIKDRGGVRFSDNLPKADVAIAYKENDILLGNIRPYLKKIWLADKVGGASGDVVIIRIKERSISPLFLFKLLSSDQFFEYDNTHIKGAKMPRGDRKAIEKFGVILPPLPLQYSFAQKIEQIEQQKAAIQKTITDLETLLAARMQYWFD